MSPEILSLILAALNTLFIPALLGSVRTLWRMDRRVFALELKAGLRKHGDTE